MPELLKVVKYAEVASEPAGQHVSVSGWSFEETIARLKASLVEEDLWLIHEIDPQALLARGGFCIRPTRQLLFFHPRYMARLLEADPAAILEAPLKIVVMEEAEGRVILRVPDVVAAFARHSGLASLGEELAAVCGRVLSTVRL